MVHNRKISQGLFTVQAYLGLIFSGSSHYTLPKLQKFMQHDGASSIFGSVVVTTKNEGIPVKIVFVRNRNKSSECLYILSTDCSLSESEIVRTYGNRWSIEMFFKASKSMLRLGSEFQSRSYDAIQRSYLQDTLFSNGSAAMKMTRKLMENCFSCFATTFRTWI